MSHHFDTKLAKHDPRLNVCDFYLFEGQRGHTVMVTTTNADVGFSSPDTFHTDEGTYMPFVLTWTEMRRKKSSLDFGSGSRVTGTKTTICTRSHSES